MPQEANELAAFIENDHGGLSALERVDTVLGVGGYGAHHAVGLADGQLSPAFGQFIVNLPLPTVVIEVLLPRLAFAWRGGERHDIRTSRPTIGYVRSTRFLTGCGLTFEYTPETIARLRRDGIVA